MKDIELAICCDGLDAEFRRVEKLIRSLGMIKEQKACRMALRAALAATRKEAARVAGTTYTARKAKLFDRIEAAYSQGTLTLRGAFGMSLFHFKPDPATPRMRPTGGVTSQVKRKGRRYTHGDRNYDHYKPFVMRKKQGGFGIFVREKGRNLPGWKGYHMLFGPSPIQALMRADRQKLVVEKATQTFGEKIQQEIDKMLAATYGK